MPAPAALPQVSSRPRPKAPLKGFESSESPKKQPKNEIAEIIRAAGEQVGGYRPESYNPIPGHDQLDKLKVQDETFKKSNYASLKERIRHVQEATKKREEDYRKQQDQLKAQMSLSKNKAPVGEAKSKGSVKDRMFSAMGIRRKQSTPSSAETSATREYGAKKTQ